MSKENIIPQDVNNLLKDISQPDFSYRTYDNRNPVEWHNWPLLEKAADYIAWKSKQNVKNLK
ncbi:hypothetical protein [Zymomonas mobilis]|uniref:hypothetical protein n=1 Tax=Zymomonas mobilis TaxID=542 RepID=UPI0039ECB88B